MSFVCFGVDEGGEVFDGECVEVSEVFEDLLF